MKRKEVEGDELISRMEFARRIGVTGHYVSMLKSQDRLVTWGHKIWFRASVERIEATKNPSKITPKPASGTPSEEVEAIRRQYAGGGQSAKTDEPLDYQSARAKREHYNAELARLEYQKSIGALMEMELLTNILYSAAVEFRSRMEQMMESLAPRVVDAESEDEVRAVIAEEVEFALDNLSKSFQRLSQETKEVN